MLKSLKTEVVIETEAEVVVQDVMIKKVEKTEEVTDVVVQEAKNEVLELIPETEVKEDVLTAARNQDVPGVQILNLRHQVLTDGDAQEDNL